MGASVVGPGHRLHASPVQHASRQHSCQNLMDTNADAHEHTSHGNWAGGSSAVSAWLAVLIFWQNWPELPRLSGKHGGSALQGCEWSCHLPKLYTVPSLLGGFATRSPPQLYEKNAIVDQSKDVKQIQSAQHRWDKRLKSEAARNCLNNGQNNQ